MRDRRYQGGVIVLSCRSESLDVWWLGTRGTQSYGRSPPLARWPLSGLRSWRQLGPALTTRGKSLHRIHTLAIVEYSTISQYKQGQKVHDTSHSLDPADYSSSESSKSSGYIKSSGPGPGTSLGGLSLSLGHGPLCMSAVMIG